MTCIDVMVLTYRRAELLERTLLSLLGQRLPAGLSMRIIVVDNDPQESARAVVARLQTTIAGLRYVCEPRTNIACARNRALTEVSAEFCAFIDDDEAAAEDWLQQLVAAQHAYAVPVVFGPVVAKTPQNAPQWATRGAFFQRPRPPTGSTPRTGASGNVLLHTQTILNSGIRFDARYGRTGGEDTDFFERLRRAGVRWVWCNEAVVFEWVESDRLRLSWLAKRAFMGGSTYARVFDAQRSGALRSFIAVTRALAAAIFGLLLPFAALAGRAAAARVVQHASKNMGRAFGVLHSGEIKLN